MFQAQKIINILKTHRWFYIFYDSKTYLKLRNQQNFRNRINETLFYKNLLGTSNKLIFDIGANVGNKSIIFSEISNKVVLFEPDIQNIKILKARFPNTFKFIIIGLALASEKGNADFFVISNDSAYNSLSIKHVNTVVQNRRILNNNKLLKYKVETNTLNHFIGQYGKPDYIKIDVEGYEKEVLYGLNQVIAYISFEANLPEFLTESLQIIEYLDHISNGNYFYNFSINNKLELDEYISASDFQTVLNQLNYRSLEIFCKLNTSNC